jgi:hypothetical protein
MVLNEVFIGREKLTKLSPPPSPHSTNFQFAAHEARRMLRRRIKKLLNFMSNELNKLNKE